MLGLARWTEEAAARGEAATRTELLRFELHGRDATRRAAIEDFIRARFAQHHDACVALGCSVQQLQGAIRAAVVREHDLVWTLGQLIEHGRQSRHQLVYAARFVVDRYRDRDARPASGYGGVRLSVGRRHAASRDGRGSEP